MNHSTLFLFSHQIVGALLLSLGFIITILSINIALISYKMRHLNDEEMTQHIIQAKKRQEMFYHLPLFLALTAFVWLLRKIEPLRRAWHQVETRQDTSELSKEENRQNRR